MRKLPLEKFSSQLNFPAEGNFPTAMGSILETMPTSVMCTCTVTWSSRSRFCRFVNGYRVNFHLTKRILLPEASAH